MNNLLYSTLVGLFSGIIGTSIGGFSAFLVKDDSKRLLSFLLEFTAGLMIAVVCFDLLPESFELASLKIGIVGIILGIGIIVIIENILDNIKKARSKKQVII